MGHNIIRTVSKSIGKDNKSKKREWIVDKIQDDNIQSFNYFNCQFNVKTPNFKPQPVVVSINLLSTMPPKRKSSAVSAAAPALAGLTFCMTGTMR